MTTIMARRAVRRTRASPTLSLVLGEVVGVATSARTSCERWRTPTGRGELDLDPIADQDQAGPVAVLDGGRRQQRGRLRGPIGLGRPLRPEPHARRDVDHQPERQRPLLDESPHERPALPRGHVPVEVAHIVARLVGPQLGERQPDSRPGPMISPGELRDRTRTHPEPQPPRPSDDRRGIQRRRPCEARRGGERPDHVRKLPSTPVSSASRVAVRSQVRRNSILLLTGLAAGIRLRPRARVRQSTLARSR